jgi:PKD repeat protein
MLSLGPQVPTRSISVAVIALVPDAVLPATYDWSFGDGATMTTASSTTFHTYTSPGTVTVSVTVTDAAGHVGTATVTTTVADLPAVKPPPVTLPPSLSASVNCTVPGGTPPPPPPVSIPCNVTAAYGGVAVPSSFVTGVDWDWGDGAKNLGAGVALSHTYGQLGTFTVFATLAATTVDGPKGPVSALLVITIP